uniref:NADH dehydrogenase (Ubiquinone) 1 alpha subcomplex 6 n=1 Tax=Tetraselmis sp. GSL018 TaxID=582737 RepID=A0A061S4I8_9CHLO|mmetsp:Transcript_33334/g.79048  ORF Transcript_33334/g.79048 Transcript_33334/m.79048 type:complete len:134 (+) Transcript_33334:93-494(+)
MAFPSAASRLKLSKDVFSKDPEVYNPLLFYRKVVREIPGIIQRYNLEELVTRQQLCRFVSDMFRANSGVREQRAVNLLVIKGEEEFDLVMRNHKQRHHLISKYVDEPRSRAEAAEEAKRDKMSAFLRAFYKSN